MEKCLLSDYETLGSIPSTGGEEGEKTVNEAFKPKASATSNKPSLV